MFKQHILVAISLTICTLAFVTALPLEASTEKQLNGNHWVDTWTSMPQLTEAANLPNPPFNGTTSVFVNTTLRQTLHMSLGGSTIRIRLSNAFGSTSLNITSMTVALPFNNSAGESAIQPQTLQTVTFSGNTSISIPDGSLAISDPLSFPINPQSEISVSIYLSQGQEGFDITSHPGSRTTSYLQFGDSTTVTNLTDPSLQSLAHWYFLSAVEIWSPATTRGFAIVGDSITDGRGSDTDANNRWPDLLLSGMQALASTKQISVLNQGAGGNRVLADGLGPSALSRIDRDILAQSGVRYAMLFEGVNDIGVAGNDTVAQEEIYELLIQAYEQIISRVHAFGIPVFGATITPFGAPNNTIQPYSDATREVTRQRVNEWIRNSGRFDAVIDFDVVVRNASRIDWLDDRYNSGDWLHPNVEGYQAMADSFDLGLFGEFARGVSGYI